MFDIGWTEMVIIAMVALIIIGPKDLPVALKNLAHWVRKGRSVMREVQRGVDDMVREAELGDLKRDLQSMSGGGLGRRIMDTVDPDDTIKDALKVEEPTTTTPASSPTPPQEEAPAQEEASPQKEAPAATDGAADETPEATEGDAGSRASA